MHYGQWCHRIYRQARCGDLDALEKLLTLDKRLLLDRRIAAQIVRLQGDPQQLQLLTEAIASQPRKLSLKQVKVSAMGLISSAAKHLNVPLNAPQLTDLFDAQAQSQSGDLHDLALPIGPETVAKAIQRAKPHWARYFNPDKDSSKPVRARKRKSA